MSDDVISLDSSDEEGENSNAKKPNDPGGKLKNNVPKSMVGPFPISLHRARESFRPDHIIKNAFRTTKTFRKIQPQRSPYPINITSPSAVYQNLQGLKIISSVPNNRQQSLQNQKYSLCDFPLHQKIICNTSLPVPIKRTHLDKPFPRIPTVSAQKKQSAISLKVINTLPPGITIKRTTGHPKITQKRPPSPADVVFSKKSKPTIPCEISNISSIPTFELDDEDDRFEVLPIEYEPDTNSKITVEVEFESIINNSSDQNDLKIEEKENCPTPSDPLNSHSIHNQLEEFVDSQTAIDEVSLNIDVKNASMDKDLTENMDNKAVCESDEVFMNEKMMSNEEAVFKTGIINKEELASVATPVIVKIMLGTKEDMEISDRLKKLSNNINCVKLGNRIFNEPISEVYQRFIDICLKLDTSDDMKKIIDKKVLAYYKSVHPSFTASNSFCELVEGKIQEITNNPSGIFLYIKAVVEELKVRRVKLKKISQETDEANNAASLSNAETNDDEEEDEENSRTNRHIAKLERTLTKLSKAIQKLEEKEVDYDDENCSSYILADRYKARLVRVYDKLCSLTGERNAVKRKTAMRDIGRLPLTSGRLKKVAEAVKAMASKKPHWFPDYREVLACVEQCAKDQKIDMRPYETQNEARLLFVEIGTMLQQRRQQQEYEDMSWRLGSDVDPADNDPALALALQLNRERSAHKEMEVINKFAEKQVTLKLEPENVADLITDSSEGSSSEDNDENLDDPEGLNQDSPVSDSEKSPPRSNGHIKVSSSNGLSPSSRHTEKKTPTKTEKINDLVHSSPIKDCKVVLENNVSPCTSFENRSVISNSQSTPVKKMSPSVVEMQKSPTKPEKMAYFRKNVMVQIHYIESPIKDNKEASEEHKEVDKPQPIESLDVIDDTCSDRTNSGLINNAIAGNTVLDNKTLPLQESKNTRLSFADDKSNDAQICDNVTSSVDMIKKKKKSSHAITSSNPRDSDDSIDSFDSNPSLIELNSSSDDEAGILNEDFKRLNSNRPDSVMSGMAIMDDSNSTNEVLTSQSNKVLQIEDSSDGV